MDPRFVYRTIPPTPTADAAEVWRTGNLPNAGPQACGTYPFQIRLEVPVGPVGTFLLNLRRSVLPWSSRGSGYRLVIRVDAPDGPVADTSDRDLGRPRIVDLSAWVGDRQAQGYIDVFPTIECEGDTWTYHPDANWGGWNIEAYHIGGARHGLDGVEHVSVWYENGLDRLEDLKKYDLVILGEIDGWHHEGIAALRKADVLVAGYVSFGEEHRPAPSEPVVGDGRGPGGYDSRYVDVRAADGTKVPDGFPDHKEAYGGRNYFTDPRSDSWRTEILDRITAQRAAGAQAVFFDTFYVTHPDLVEGVRGFMEAVRAAFPDLKVIVNDYELYREVGGLVHAVMFESFSYAHGERLDPERLRIRDEHAALVNALRGHPTPTFDVIALDYVDPGSGAAVDDAVARAESLGFVPALWRMVALNPANRLRAEGSPTGVELTWHVYDAEPDPETLARVGSYEVRRSSQPIRTTADFQAAEIVVADLPPGTRQAFDPDPLGRGDVHYAVGAYRQDTGRLLQGLTVARLHR